MFDEYEKEIKALEENNQIEDKLMVFAMYNEMFNHFRYSMSDYYRTYYENLMRDIFVKVIGSVRNVREFIAKFTELLKKERLSRDVRDVKESIDYFLETEEDNIKGMYYVPTIDKYQFPFHVKARSLVMLRNHINNVLCRLYEIFGESEAIKDVANDVIYYSDVAINSYFESCVEYKIEPEYICNSLDDVLKMGTKVCLLNLYVDGYFNFELIANKDTRNYFLSFRDIEQAVLLAGMAYGISGYPNEDYDEERVKEICAVLGISKPKYYFTIASLAVKKASLSKKQAKEEQKRLKYEQ